MCVWVLHLGLAMIPGAKTWAPLSTALPHWAPTTTSELSCFTGLRTQEKGRSHTSTSASSGARRLWLGTESLDSGDTTYPGMHRQLFTTTFKLFLFDIRCVMLCFYIYTPDNKMSVCRYLLCWCCIFFPIYLGSGCSLSGTWQMRSATCFLPSSRHEIPCGFCPQETPVQRSHTQLQFRF